MKRRLTLILAGLFAGFAATASAQNDDALYDPAPPPNSSFARVIDARGEGNLQATIGDVSLTLPEAGVSAYVVVPAGEQDVALSSDVGKVTLEAGKYYSIVFFLDEAPGVTLLEDEVLTNPAKSGVYVYNFTDAPSIRLFAPKQKVAVIDEVGPGASGFRSVNAVTVDLDVMAGETAIASFPQVALKRRSGLSFIVYGPPGDMKAVWVQNETAR